ncbi:MAG: hypothetical protein H7236_05240 [Gemmatimonadaceae bacterium]|nr:hypothetical protein [Caulobacter sp.]
MRVSETRDPRRHRGPTRALRPMIMALLLALPGMADAQVATSAPPPVAA